MGQITVMSTIYQKRKDSDLALFGWMDKVQNWVVRLGSQYMHYSPLCMLEVA